MCNWQGHMFFSLLAAGLAMLAVLAQQPTTPTPAAVAALVSIVQELFITNVSSFMITLPPAAVGMPANWLLADTLSPLLRELHFIKVQIESGSCQQPAAPHASHTRHFNLILLDSVEALRRINPAAQTVQSDFNEFYIVQLLPPPPSWPDAVNETMASIFAYFWAHYLPNVSLLYSPDAHTVELYTYFVHTSAGSCAVPQMRRINRYRSQLNGWQRQLRSHVFPQKLQDLHGCTLRVALWHIPPYIIMGSGEQSEPFSGFEGTLLQQLAKRLNFSLAIRVPPDGTMRGRILSNGSSTGAIKMLGEGSADLSLGSFRYTLERLQLLSSTLPYYQTSQTYSVLMHAHSHSSLELWAFPFQLATWCCLLLLLLLNLMLGSYCAHHCQRQLGKLHLPDMSALLVVSIFFGLPVRQEPQMDSARLLLVLWFFGGLLLRTAYESLLYRLLQTDLYMLPPRSLAELQQQSYTLVMTRNTYDTVMLAPDLQRSRLRIVVLPNETASDLSTYMHMERESGERLAGISPLDFLMYYIASERKHGMFYVLPEIVFTQHITMYFGKHSYLVARFNELLQRLRYFGLIDYWAHEHMDRTAFQATASQTTQAHPISACHLKSIFWIYLLLCFCACFIFLLELCWLRLIAFWQSARQELKCLWRKWWRFKRRRLKWRWFQCRRIR